MRNWIVPLLLQALFLSACGGADSEPGRATPTRGTPEATVARWVDTGDCSLFTDNNVSAGYDSVAEGRRACQAEADRMPVERSRVETTRVRGDEAAVVLALAEGRRMTFWLVPRGERDWQIDGYEERRPHDGTTGALEVIAAFERRTGERLSRLPELSPPAYQTLGFRKVAQVGAGGEDSSGRFHELLERFGVFTINVAFDVNEAKWIVKGVDPDERGLHWQRRGSRGSEPPEWGADKRYGNVVLSWAAGTARRTDHSFDLLDAILREARRSARP